MTRANVLTLAALALIIPAANYGAGLAYAELANMGEQPALADTAAAEPEWVASAPGRVEPKTGEIKIGATLNGRIIAVLVAEGQKVARGDILLQLDDDGATAKFQSAKVEAARAKKDRDDAGGGDSDYRVTEDDLANAELSFWNARDALDRMGDKVANHEASDKDLEEARKSYVTAENLLKAKRSALIDLQSRKKRPNPSRQESALANARAEQSMAAAIVEKTHVRAPIDGVILKLDAKVGEIVALSPEQVLITLGDTTSLRVKAEVEERDVGHLKVGQQAIVRCDAFQGQDFAGHIASMAPALIAPELGGRGAGRRTDVDVLEVYVDLDAPSPLLPGLRVDVFFKQTAAAGNGGGSAAAPAPAPGSTAATGNAPAAAPAPAPADGTAKTQ